MFSWPHTANNMQKLKKTEREKRETIIDQGRNVSIYGIFAAPTNLNEIHWIKADKWKWTSNCKLHTNYKQRQIEYLNLMTPFGVERMAHFCQQEKDEANAKKECKNRFSFLLKYEFKSGRRLVHRICTLRVIKIVHDILCRINPYEMTQKCSSDAYQLK